MVERCADCGFDLAGGLVEVVPTAHYMMGGVEFARATAPPRCRASSSRARIRAACTAPTASAATAWRTRRCSAPSPATRWRRGSGHESLREPDRGGHRCRGRGLRARRSGRDGGELRSASARSSTTSCGRRSASSATRAGLEAARGRAAPRSTPSSMQHALADQNRAFNLTWHDWMNLKSLVAVSRAITAAALARTTRAARISGPTSRNRAARAVRVHQHRSDLDGDP